MKNDFDGEYGKKVEEFIQPSETVEYPEMVSYKEMEETPDEIKGYKEAITNNTYDASLHEESGASSSGSTSSGSTSSGSSSSGSSSSGSGSATRIKKNSSKLKSILKTSGAVVATVAVVTVIAPTIFSSDDAQVTFGDVTATDTSIACAITLENTSDSTYTAVLYNNFTEREQTIDGGTLDWSESSLQPNMKYTLAIKSDGKTIAEKDVKTVAKMTVWYSVESACNCRNTGNFEFIMSFRDDYGWWTDFEATLTDSKGTVSKCIFTDDLSELQEIPVTGVLYGETATFTITCISTENSADGELITLFTSAVEI